MNHLLTRMVELTRKYRAALALVAAAFLATVSGAWAQGGGGPTTDAFTSSITNSVNAGAILGTLAPIVATVIAAGLAYGLVRRMLH